MDGMEDLDYKLTEIEDKISGLSNSLDDLKHTIEIDSIVNFDEIRDSLDYIKNSLDSIDSDIDVTEVKFKINELAAKFTNIIVPELRRISEKISETNASIFSLNYKLEVAKRTAEFAFLKNNIRAIFQRLGILSIIMIVLLLILINK
jgi:uncharacterized coiled-coil DUF342 family protein